MNSEPQYHCLHYNSGHRAWIDSLYNQTASSCVTKPADHIAEQIASLSGQISDDYFDCSKLNVPTKMIVSPGTYNLVRWMPGFDEHRNRLHFYQPHQMAADYRPDPSDDQSVAVEIGKSQDNYLFE